MKIKLTEEIAHQYDDYLDVIYKSTEEGSVYTIKDLRKILEVEDNLEVKNFFQLLISRGFLKELRDYVYKVNYHLIDNHVDSSGGFLQEFIEDIKQQDFDKKKQDLEIEQLELSVKIQRQNISNRWMTYVAFAITVLNLIFFLIQFFKGG